MAIEKEFTLESVEAILKHSGILRTLFTIRKHIFHPSFCVSIEKLCSLIGLELDKCSNLPTKIRKKNVMAVSAVQPTFQKGCICVQMYDDTEDDMRWAVKNGAYAIVVKKIISGLPCIVHDFPEKIYAQMCGYYRSLSKVMTVAVTGSIGKTTTKRMINAVLKQKYDTICNPTNENALYQVGFCAQHIPSEAEFLIQEISEDTPSYTQLMSEAIKPDVAVITTIDNSHMEAFGQKENIIKEICSITNGMSSDGIVIVNKDEFKWFDYLKVKHYLTISIYDNTADFYASNIQVDHHGLKFDVWVKEVGKNYSIELNNIYAVHNVISSLLAFAVGYYYKVDTKDIVNGLKGFKMSGVRQNILETKNGIVVYADCYNAVARSVKSAIEACEKIPISGKRIAVLGDIEECGKESENEHKEIINAALKSNFSILVTIGSKIYKAINDINIKNANQKLIYCHNHQEVVDVLKETCINGDLVLFKSSHAGKLEQIINILWPEDYATINESGKNQEYTSWWNRVKRN